MDIDLQVSMKCYELNQLIIGLAMNSQSIFSGRHLPIVRR